MVTWENIDRIQNALPKDMLKISDTKEWYIFLPFFDRNVCSYTASMLHVVDEVFRIHFGIAADIPLKIVQNTDTNHCPSSFFEHGFINLDFQGLKGCKIIYQAAHEFLHYFYFSAMKIESEWRWLEETFCELSSLAVVQYLSRHWGDYPQYFSEVGNRAAMKKYLDDLYAETPFYDVSYVQTLYAEHFDKLRSNPYLRDINSSFARYLLHSVKNMRSFWADVKSFFQGYKPNRSLKSNLLHAPNTENFIILKSFLLDKTIRNAM